MKPIFDLVLLMVSVLGLASCNQDEDPTGPHPGPDGENIDYDITIYYGLNDSHSRDWAQVSDDGLVGIAYCQRFAGSRSEGSLLYKTIDPDGAENVETVTTGTRLEKAVLLFDSLSSPHIFVARSNDTDQAIDHYRRNEGGQWQTETIINFHNEGGRFIYELSADVGPDDSFHLLILKSIYNPDSDEFMEAWEDSYLYHLTNASEHWERELIHNYDMAYTYDMYIKSSIRQDMQVDGNGHVHVIFSEQDHAPDSEDDPSRLWYASNASGGWLREVALSYDHGPRDDAGWFPSLALDNNGVPFISCMYINRVMTRSATYAKLYFLERLGDGSWSAEVIADRDDGYYGGDGRDYTGGLSHLVFDSQNNPRIIFTDIASTHWPGTQRLNPGNIRYGTRDNGVWSFNTIHRQPLPDDYFTATEMFGMVLLVSEQTNTIRVVGQELVLATEHDYTSRLLEFSWEEVFR